MQPLAIQRGLWVAVLAAQVLLIGSLVQKKLARRYPFFILYLAADAVWGVTLMQVDFNTQAYAYGYRIYTIMACALQLGVAGELYERICEHYVGIGNFRLHMAGWMAAVMALLSFLTFRPDLAAQWGFPQTMAIWAERYELAVICGVLILTRLFLHNFMAARPPMRPNVLRHWTILVCYFGVIAAGFAAFLSVHNTPSAIYAINLTMLAGELACLLAWTRVLTPIGEAVPEAYQWSAAGLARRQAIANRVLELVERTRDELRNRS
jgi:hypothetical protein